jgi:transcription-repair coupling factor (superfamily II helicase)
LIIEDSERLGLAQLYQLKGRVGRSHAQAFAYFLFPSAQALTPTAADRLMAIGEHHELGSGMRIAMRDLEIRGAGSLLGAEQSGNLTAVGFDLFASMLAQAVEQTRSQAPEAHPDVRIDLPLHFYLPEELIAAADERVMWYRRFAGVKTLADADAFEQQLMSEYGGIPAPAANVIAKARAKVLADSAGITNIGLARAKFILEPVSLNSEQAAVAKRQGAIYFIKSHKLDYPLKDKNNMMAELLQILHWLNDDDSGDGQ